MLLTAAAQGVLAGIGYGVIGAPFPVLLALLTTLSSFIPFGPPFIYVPLALSMALSGTSWITVAVLLIWCVGVVSTLDNLLRPLFISRTTNLSFLLVLFGILGGLASFGMLGVFIGPVVMVLAVHLWDELIRKNDFAAA